MGDAAGTMVSVLAMALSLGAAHPIHSSLTTVAWRQETRTLEVAIRLFTQDLQDALARRKGSGCEYAQAVLTLHDAAGRTVPTDRCTIVRDGDVTWIRLIAAPGDLHALRLSNSLLFELFEDQINIVQSSVDGRARTVLFTRGDGPKALT